MTRGAANRRIVVLGGAFVVLLGAAFGRAFWLQAVQGDAYAAMATRQHRETVVVPAGRGTVFDRNGKPLAIGEQATTVFANPQQVDRPRQLTLAIAKELDLHPAAVYPLLVDRSKGFVYIARKVDPDKARSAREARLRRPRLLLRRSFARTRRSASPSQVLGYAGLDNAGLEGLERSLNKVLAGKPGSQTIVKDPLGRALDVVSDAARRRPAGTCG